MLKKRFHPLRAQTRKQSKRDTVAPANHLNTLFEKLFESGPEAQVLVDSDGQVVAANRQAEALFGYARDEMVGRPVEDLVPAMKRAAHVQHRKDFMEAPYARPAQGEDVSRRTDLSGRPLGTASHLLEGIEVTGQLELELSAQRKDGIVFPAEIMLNPIQAGGKQYVLSVVRDVTVRHQREQALREQSDLIRLLQDVAIAANEADSVSAVFQFAVDRLCQHLGWPVGHALFKGEDQVLSPTNIWNRTISDQFSYFRQATELMRFQPGVGLPGMVLSSGQPVWLNVNSSSIFARSAEAEAAGLKTGLAIPVLSGHNVVGALEFFNTETLPSDPRLMAVLPHIGVQLARVIERKQSEEALRKSAAQLRMVITSLPVFLWVTDRLGKIIMLEGRGVAALDVKPETILGKSVYELSRQQPELIEQINRALTGETIHVEMPANSGAVFETYFTPYYDVNWAVDGVIGLSFDVSERKRMESELDEMKHRLMSAIENERAHLGQQIHDGPLQDLYGAFYQVQDIKNLLGERDQETANRVLNTLQDVSATLRMICGELHPSILVHLGLQKSIRSHAEQLQERLEGTIIHLDLDEEKDDLDSAMSSSMRLALFRVYQSLISNAARHAQARHVWVRLRFSAKQVMLEVQDNGSGFDLPEHWVSLIRAGKVGLVSTLERVESLGGKMDVHTKAGKGTLVRVTVPV